MLAADLYVENLRFIISILSTATYDLQQLPYSYFDESDCTADRTWLHCTDPFVIAVDIIPLISAEEGQR